MSDHHREAWERLNERGRIGVQYPILASYAEQNGIDWLETGIFGSGFLRDILQENTVIEITRTGDTPIIPEDVDGPVRLFKSFVFPLLGRTKLDMKEEAERRGWMPIMRKTWFCHTPVLGFPCGACHPCEIAQAEGMGKRVGHVGPLLARASSLLSWMRRV